ncbi:MAG: hypothetical protein IJX99_02220 [Clostridia bacterium]|nr:hypothetical protein [Clostridia bacterium]
MNNYFKLQDIEKQEVPHQYGYKAVLVEDKINEIGFYRLEKTEELKEIESLKQKLLDTDYQAIKFGEGQISEEEYTPIKEKRQAWRDRINELEAELEV